MITRNPFSVMHEPAESLLRRFGITTRVNHKGTVIWLNMDRCPACRHKDYQCGVSESAGADGALYHGVKCFHAQDNPWNTQNPEYEDFLCALGALTFEEAEEVRNYRSRGAPVSANQTPDSKARADESLKPLNLEFLGRLKKRLRENAVAMNWLKDGRGLESPTLDHFGLGLSMPYPRRNGQISENALVYPLMLSDGKFYNRYGYYNIPEVTKNPVDKNGWMPGSVRAYYAGASGESKSLFVCEGAKDVWRHWQALRGEERAGDLLLVTSTHGSAFPADWKQPAFWRQWKTLYFGHDNDPQGDAISAKLLELCGRNARRVSVPKCYGKDWTDFWQSGGSLDEFFELLDAAPVLEQRERPRLVAVSDQNNSDGPGEYAYDPIDINGAFHNGHLYHPVRILNKSCELVHTASGEEAIQNVEWLETIVVRSDRTYHRAKWVSAPLGKRMQDRVLRLDDGTLIDHEPQPNKYATWSWPSIKRYLEGKGSPRPLAQMVRDVVRHLRSSIWLPYEEDYTLLAFTVPVTYAQSVFESVPLLFVNGPKGSGKSGLGRAMAQVCANSYVCGQSSAASIARFIDQSRGFVVLDDLESIASKGGEFSELAQALKLSYTKKTATKLWTDVKTMRTMHLNFYGVKMINNTQGADDILSSRMLRVQTRKLPDHLREEFLSRQQFESLLLNDLRDEFHTWVYESVGEIDRLYREMFPKLTDRAQEIESPLRVVAALANDPELTSQLEISLTRQKVVSVDPDDPRALLHEALRNLVAQGYSIISTTHLLLEMRSLTHKDLGKTYASEIPEWSRVEWVGRMLRSHDLIDPDLSRYVRKRLYGANLRFYPVHGDFIEETRKAFEGEGVQIQIGTTNPVDFCGGCSGCPYKHVNCEIMPRRLEAEGEKAY